MHQSWAAGSGEGGEEKGYTQGMDHCLDPLCRAWYEEAMRRGQFMEGQTVPMASSTTVQEKERCWCKMSSRCEWRG